MAKGNDLKAAIKELKKNYKQVLGEAVKYATEEAQKDVHTRALTCLEEYYANYDPSSYDRRDKASDLRNAFLPYKKIESNATHSISTVGIVYNTSLLSGYVVGSRDYGKRDIDKKRIENGQVILPIEEWIMNNYLDGIHPTTDGSGIIGEAIYTEIIDKESPTQKMDNYLENYADKFADNVYAYLSAYIM